MASFPKGGFEQLPRATTDAAVSAQRLVQRHTTGNIRHAVADSDIVGVTMEAGASGSTPRIARLKNGLIVEVDALTANAVAIGDRLTSGASGVVQTTTTAGEVVVGIALSSKAAATAGSVLMQISPTVVPS